jgi:hypothetical protein
VNDLEMREPCPRGFLTQDRHIPAIELDQTSPYVCRVWIVPQHSEQVLTLPGAQTQHGEGIRERVGQNEADLRLDNCQPAAQG